MPANCDYAGKGMSFELFLNVGGLVTTALKMG